MQLIEPIHIELRFKTDFNDYSDIHRVFDCFSIVSWFTNNYRVRVYSRTVCSIKHFKKTVFSFVDEMEKERIYDVYEIEKNREGFFIKYSFVEHEKEFVQENLVTVNITEEKYNQTICIEVRDINKFLQKNYSTKIEKIMGRQSNSFIKSNQLKYCYIEPEDKRFKTFQKPHFSLAFQGGGAKGLAYIGAYKSLVEAHPETQIKSVIGSSAGSIIALAITAGNSVESMIEMMSQLQYVSKHKIIKSTQDVTQQKKLAAKKVMEDIRQILHEYGLVYHQLFDLIVKQVLTDDVIEVFLQILSENNPALKEIFSIDVEETHPVILNLKKTVKKLQNYYGFCEGALLKGTIIEDLAIRIIHGLFLSKLSENKERVREVIGCDFEEVIPGARNKFLDQHAMSLTLKQLYDLTDVQFTCTAVDIEDKIIRFFNHKTTPNLPAYIAVRLSSSFPVVFQAQRWKKEWGYYYIHHRRRRIEIDLVGHRFTDGGVLANFPIKYLDNEMMRPKYFSHKQNEHTKVFGFGLHFVTEEEDSSIISTKQDQSEKIEKLKKLILQKFPKNKFLQLQIRKKPSPKQIDINTLPSLKKIPVIEFLLSLFETYQSSNDNLVRECFFFQSYIFTEDVDLFQQVQNQKVDVLLKKYRGLGQTFTKLRSQLQSIPFLVKTFDQRIQNHKEFLKSQQVTAKSITDIADFIKRIIVGYGKFSTERSASLLQKKQPSNAQIIQKVSSNLYKLLKRLNQLYKHSFFIKVLNIKRNTKLILEFLEQIKMQNIINQFKDEKQKQFITNYLTQFLHHTQDEQDSKIKTILTMIGEKISSILNYQVKPNDFKDQFCRISFNNKLFRHIIDFNNGFTDPFLKEFNEFQKSIKEIGLSHLIVKQSIFNQTSQIWSYIKDVVQGRDPSIKDIHLVFQGLGNSSNYYFQAYNIVNQYLTAEESKKEIQLQQKLASFILKTQNKEKQQQISQLSLREKKYIFRKLSNSIYSMQSEKSVMVSGHVFQINDDMKERILEELNQKKKSLKRVAAITCGNLHSILGFLICGGFSDDKIEEEMKHIKYLTKVSKNIDQKYYEKDWVNPTNYQMRQLQDKIWEERYQMFEELEKIAVNDQTLLKKLSSVKYEFNESKSLVVNGFQEVMDFLIETEIQKPDSEDLTEYFSKKLLLRSKTHNYYKEAQNVSNGAQKLIFDIVEMFSEQISMVMISALSSVSPLTERIKRESDSEKRKLLWRGFLIDVFMDASNVKKKVYDLLEELYLPKDISLKQFYEISPKKIQLNFLAVNLKSERICIINRHTFPSMALWAAILISASYPPLYEKVRGKQEWLEQIHESFKEKAVNQVFKDARSPNFKIPVFVSGNLLASFPLELLHNQQVGKIYLKNQKYIYLSFGINLKDNTKNQVIKFNRSFISIYDIFLLLRKIFSLYITGAELKPTFDFFAISNKLKILETYMESNDQLMLELYKNNLLLLPIRFNTLDFHKLGDEELIKLTIEETSLMTIEKLSLVKQIFFKIKLTKQYIFIYFLSRDLNNRNDSTKYNIFYSQPPHKADSITFVSVKKQIIAQRNINFILLRFQFARTATEIQQTTYKISFQTLSKSYTDLTAIYELKYDVVVNQLVTPLFVTNKCLASQKDDTRIKITSILNIETDGLYCQRCCCSLHPENYEHDEYKRIFLTHLMKKECYHCRQDRFIRFHCPDCSANYCVMCTNKLILKRTEDEHCLICFKKHLVHYIYESSQLEQHTFTICDNCREYVQDYYFDEDCNIHLCYACANSIVN